MQHFECCRNVFHRSLGPCLYPYPNDFNRDVVFIHHLQEKLGPFGHYRIKSLPTRSHCTRRRFPNDLLCPPRRPSKNGLVLLNKVAPLLQFFAAINQRSAHRFQVLPFSLLRMRSEHYIVNIQDEPALRESGPRTPPALTPPAIPPSGSTHPAPQSCRPPRASDS